MKFLLNQWKNENVISLRKSIIKWNKFHFASKFHLIFYSFSFFSHILAHISVALIDFHKDTCLQNWLHLPFTKVYLFRSSHQKEFCQKMFLRSLIILWFCSKFSQNSTKITVEEFVPRKFSAEQPTTSLKVSSSISILEDVDEISRTPIMPNISWWLLPCVYKIVYTFLETEEKMFKSSIKRNKYTDFTFKFFIKTIKSTYQIFIRY